MPRKPISEGTLVRDREGRYRLSGAVSEDRLVAEVARILEARIVGAELTKPNDAREFLRLRLGPLEHEAFSCLFLDTRHRVLEFSVIFRGSIASATIHPREVVKDALKLNAAAVIFAHNHPSGVAEPSAADMAITRKLVEALTLVDIRVLDHIVVGHAVEASFAELGLL